MILSFLSSKSSAYVYSSLAEFFSLTALSCPYGPKLKIHVISTLWGSTSTYRRYFDDAGFAFISAKNLEGWNKFPPDSDGPVRDLRKYLGTKKGLFYIHEQALITTLLSRDQVTKIMYVQGEVFTDISFDCGVLSFDIQIQLNLFFRDDA